MNFAMITGFRMGHIITVSVLLCLDGDGGDIRATPLKGK